MRQVINIVDDDNFMLQYLTKILRSEHIDIKTFSSPTDFMANVRHSIPDIIISDLLMPGLTGMELARTLHDTLPYVPVVMITTESKVETAVQAMKEGVVDYIVKPIDIDEFRQRVERALEIGSLRRKSRSVWERKRKKFSVSALVGESKTARRSREMCLFAENSPGLPFWFIGENGTGKRFLASAIHYATSAPSEDFLLYTCRADEADICARELFEDSGDSIEGKVIGRGLLEQVSGTLIIENPEFLSQEAQIRLASYLQKFSASKADKHSSRRVRVICVSTAQDEDAFFASRNIAKELRLCFPNTIHSLVPLAKRKEDIFALAELFLKRFAKHYHRHFSFAGDVSAKLLQYHWAGNIAELINSIERAAMYAPNDEISAKDIGAGTFSHTASANANIFQISQGLKLKELDGEYVRQTLEFFGGSLEKTADSLGVSRKTLWEIRKKHNIQ